MMGSPSQQSVTGCTLRRVGCALTSYSCKWVNCIPLCHSVFVALGVSMWLAPFPLPRVESLAQREGEEPWVGLAVAGIGWVVQKMLRVNWWRGRSTCPQCDSGEEVNSSIAGRGEVVWNDMCRAAFPTGLS